MKTVAPKKSSILLFSGALLLAIQACPGQSTKSIGSDLRKAFLADLATKQIIPIYQELAVGTATLSVSAQRFCENPTERGLEKLQMQWNKVRSTWKRSEVFAFGPVKEYPWRIGPKIDLWPVRPNEIERTLIAKPWSETMDLSLATGFSVGFPAFEYLIYGIETSSTSTPLSRLIKTPDACTYLSLLGQDLQNKTRALYEAWTPEGDNFVAELTMPSMNSTVFKDVDSSFTEVINRLGYTIENMREIKIAKPAGYGGGSLDTSLLESHLSDRSLEDLSENLLGIELVYKGSYLQGQGKGVSSLVPQSKDDINQAILSSIENVKTVLEEFDISLKTALKEDPEKVRKLYDALKQLQWAMQVDLFQLLGINVGFNDTDGD